MDILVSKCFCYFPAGYVYILFESEKSVKSLLQSCTQDFSNGGEYYFKISSRRMRSKEVSTIYGENIFYWFMIFLIVNFRNVNPFASGAKLLIVLCGRQVELNK